MHDEPHEDARRSKPYLVKWDTVAVLDQQDGWARVEYVESVPPARGWIKAADLALAAPSGG
ncbi:hypothetical protein FPY71_09570 [Aureimonas fodinaquatilis]|uniref:SH3 domain-containing protein n=1 Tax=Aureimonas fodinaquatilis TaxID=2565783 RepID=A0A5B0DXQ4_9HYPH|nr:hypothetical protein FPY71_09570 [Aureimonas fodinaquatilis]